MEAVPEKESGDKPVKVPVSEVPAEESAPRLSESNLLDDTSKTSADNDADEELPKSSAENIIPLDKLKNGWNAVSGFMWSAAEKVKTTAVDAYNSEQAAAIKRRTSEVVTPAWEKTCEAAAPIWAATVSSANYAAEKTKEGAEYAKDVVVDQITALTGKKGASDGKSSGETSPTEGVEAVPTPPTASGEGQASSTDSAPPTPPVQKGPPTIV